MQNPLLTTDKLPAFSEIRTEHIEPALDQLLSENRARIATLLNQPPPYKWETLIQPMEILDNRLHKMWSPVAHLHAVAQNEDLRKAYHNCLPKLTAYTTELGQNKTLYRALLALQEHPDFKEFNTAQQKVITNQLLDLQLAGVALSDDKKKRFAEIQTQLAKLANQFEEHVLDATASWHKLITDENELSGIPQHVIDKAREHAQQKNLNGWLLTLDHPCYFPVMTHANNRSLREEMYTANVTRASNQGPQAGQFDNNSIMQNILTLRKEKSQLLNKENYAELSLVRKMVKKPQDVLIFLHQLIDMVRPQAQQEFQDLKEFARRTDGMNELQAWDIAYYSEKLREQDFGISDETLRPYFPEQKVVQGMFTVVERLYGIKIMEIKNVDTWHKDVRFFAIHDQKDKLCGEFYLDLYARKDKREGAWMDHYANRLRLSKTELQTPVAYLNCNLTLPSDDKPALFTHDEVVTIFHEFGHGLHHLLTQIDYSDVSGINGVEWDAVELPSQFMEFFTWEKSVLPLISGHYVTNDPLPEALLQQMLNAKNFYSGLHLLRQLEFALFDFRLHLEFDPTQDVGQIQKILDKIRTTISVVPVPPFNRFQNTFSHIFAGGYAAGYYSYLWAEMLASDAYAKFEENGVLDPATGQWFLQNILQQGGSKDAIELFIGFRGRPPTIDAMLRYAGIKNSTPCDRL